MTPRPKVIELNDMLRSTFKGGRETFRVLTLYAVDDILAHRPHRD